MPGVPMPILNTIQPIAGVDIHISLPPIPPAPAPHVVVWGVGLSGWMSLPLWQAASKTNAIDHPDVLAKRAPVSAWVGHPCGRGHDAGPHLGHIAANTLLAIIWLGASSKAEFASGTVHTPQGRMAVNMMWFANLHLDCGDPVAMPTGLAITIDYSICAGFTWMDLLNGFVHMLVDFLIDALLSLLLGAIGVLLGGAIQRVLKKYALIGLREALWKIGIKEGFGEGVPEALRAFKQWNVRQRVQNLWSMWQHTLAKDSATRPEVIKELAKSTWDTLFGLSAGGPTGSDAPFAPYKHVAGDEGLLPVDKGIDSLFYDEPPAAR
jgi:hypothetical protein